MTAKELETLRYPIGKFNCPDHISKEHIESWIAVLEHFPNRLKSLVSNLSEEQLNTSYRPQGWTVRQVIHHIGDSHHHCYSRLKWTLTEESPIIKTYYEDRWAELIDSKEAPIEIALDYIKALHGKMVYLLNMLEEEDLNKHFIHPETNSQFTLKYTIGNYAWHSNHHYVHIENLLKRKGWI
ncbi:YfiT family bacillithiol transferase [Flavisericum labens]|uniref:YfiT family bacillithiol transferase n=1 Tax=Flavisericum labens TaxID=3377112 RepID=UPI00387B888B